MSGYGFRIEDSERASSNDRNRSSFCCGGLFLDANASSSSFVSALSREIRFRSQPVRPKRKRIDFLCLSLSIKGKDGKISVSAECLNGAAVKADKLVKVKVRGIDAVNTSKHLSAGAVAAMVSRTCLAPLERLKLEYIVRGEKCGILELIKRIATTQGLRGFWKGNFVNILRTAPFKAINFCAYDTYRKQIRRFSSHEDTTNSERFIAGAAAGITATVLCLPLDTIRTRLVAPGGEAMGGVVGAFAYVIRNEGFFSLYKGLLPSILSMGPSGAVFYGVYDLLKSVYLHSSEGRKRLEKLKKKYHDLNAFEQLELGPMRTLLHGAIAGACAEAATYPFEVVRRQLQLQGRANKLSTFATCVKIIDRGGIPALYAGLIPSLLQVLPSASISFLVYEFMKIVLQVE